MRPILDDLELPHVQEIATAERRVLAEHKPPGMDGSLLQNLGRQPTRLVLWGVAAGPDAREFVDQLQAKFRARRPLPFSADIVTDAEIDTMLIEDLQWQELAGKPERFAYALTLRDFITPVEPADALAVDTSVLADARSLMEGLIPGLDIGLDFVSGLERFVGPLTDILARLRQFGDDVERARGH